MKTTLSIVVTVVFLVVSLAKASTDTNGANGINATGLTVNGQPLNGSGVSIGQVESYRAGKKNDPDTTEYNDHVTPFKVFDNVGLVPDSLGPPGGDNGIHAETVASVMISTDPTDPDGAGPRTPPTGVAPGARLLSIAAGVGKSFMPDQAAVLCGKLASHCHLCENELYRCATNSRDQHEHWSYVIGE